MPSMNFFCNISSYDILAYITKNYIPLIYYVKKYIDKNIGWCLTLVGEYINRLLSGKYLSFPIYSDRTQLASKVS
jgi:hypothetical protein